MSDLQGILANTIGVMVCGIMISNLLFGCLTMQVFTYYQDYPHDSWRLKTLVRLKMVLAILC